MNLKTKNKSITLIGAFYEIISFKIRYLVLPAPVH